MNPTIKAFLDKERVCVLAVPLADGSPHAAAMHYSNTYQPLKLYFQTGKESLKCRALRAGDMARASVVVGFNETEMLTLQMRGMLREVTAQGELEALWRVHYRKQPQAEQYKGPDSAFLEFTPAWWRYTDFTTDPETMIQG
ncbi:MAG: hypothetical protein COV10_00295 [Candidatus Vogelbacteria bacterium CG10_big_fil_rev_8_21_14_0_10_51_16]|uniref:Pyridoxamine 5'-phosphate oxidase N-terminal domain-containing protein n=1 Tax=Candidatus Vogelbacteria bacterium CG10_big_fil_rev_8_21_14_0_10_51_16 TaxID=1975045 RepID=A0A2H0RFN5_9BACT|nr:MAG: hypothetical protein COV10_00295 [Candidatus Vogelbacteria bacterium CG10_big_fil_rev_8_21_14_0_10_51_16]